MVALVVWSLLLLAGFVGYHLGVLRERVRLERAADAALRNMARTEEGAR